MNNNDVTKLVGLELNFRKTQYVTNQVDKVGHVTIENMNIDKVVKYKYLGQMIRIRNTNQELEIKERIKIRGLHSMKLTTR